MKVILYAAISIDGFIATKNGDSDWVADADAVNFEQHIKDIGCIVLGRRTFDQYRDEIYPVDNVTNIVLTSNTSLISSDSHVAYALSPTQAIQIAKEKGHDQMLVVGGGITNGLFYKENLIDELFVSVHPLILGDGIKIFENVNNINNLQLIDQRELDGGLLHLHYKVLK